MAAARPRGCRRDAITAPGLTESCAVLKVIVDNVNAQAKPGDRGAQPPVDGAVTHPALVRLLGYWHAKRGERRWPSRADIDPLELRFILGNIVLVDVSWRPLQFRYRLVGSNIVERIGYDPTGRDPALNPDPEFRARVLETFTFVANTGRVRSRSAARTVGRFNLMYDALTLPLSTDQQRVDMLMVGQFYSETTRGPAAA